MTGRSGNALLLAALFGLYVLTGKLGLSVASVHASATAVWPPTGVALAAFLTLGYECWPAIFAGAFVVNISTAGSVATSLGIATGNRLEAPVGAYLVNRFGTGVRTFERAQDVFKFAGLAAVLSTIVGATTGVASLSLAGHAAWADWGRIWLTWWLGDMTGALIVAPLLILWIQNPRPDLVRRRPLEAACLCLVTILVGLAVFGEGVVFFGLRTFLLTFFCTLPLLWAAFRFRQREAAVLIAVLSGIAIWAMLRGSGPFAGVTANESLLLLQSFMGTVSVMILSAAALVEERRRVDRDREDLLAREQAARAEAEGAGRAKDEFLAMLGYELRNPCAIIISAVSVLDRIESQEDFAVRARGAIRHQITHLSRLVDDLLDVAHVASGKIVLSCQPLNLATSVQRCVSVLAGTGRLERHIVDVQAEPAWAHADPTRLDQIVSNLLANAAKYTPPGGTIRVRVRGEGDEAVVRVADTGIGIPVGLLPRIFDLFVQGERGLDRAKGERLARGRPHRHRAARNGWLRGCPPATSVVAGTGDASARAHRLWAASGLSARPWIRLRRLSDEACRSRGARANDRNRRSNQGVNPRYSPWWITLWVRGVSSATTASALRCHAVTDLCSRSSHPHSIEVST